MFETLNPLLVREIVSRALQEDLGTGDITASGAVPPGAEGTGEIKAKKKGIIAGIPVAAQVFSQLNPEIRFAPLSEEGSEVTPGQIVAEVGGPLRDILGGERVALNFLQRLSGIATKTAAFVQLAAPHGAKIADTRKTTPGLRVLEKYAVRVGGGVNHRFGLYDAVLIKDNHIRAAGGITAAVENVRKHLSFTVKIEVEVTSLAEMEEALMNEVDLIMLDNMSEAEIREAVKKRGEKKVLLEASGNIAEENLPLIAASGVDIVSSGALTHSAQALDISLDLKIRGRQP